MLLLLLSSRWNSHLKQRELQHSSNENSTASTRNFGNQSKYFFKTKTDFFCDPFLSFFVASGKIVWQLLEPFPDVVGSFKRWQEGEAGVAQISCLSAAITNSRKPSNPIFRTHFNPNVSSTCSSQHLFCLSKTLISYNLTKKAFYKLGGDCAAPYGCCTVWNSAD